MTTMFLMRFATLVPLALSRVAAPTHKRPQSVRPARTHQAQRCP